MKQADHRRVLRYAVLVSVAAFAFAFALVPLYRIMCERVLGIKLEDRPAAAKTEQMQVDNSRWVTVEFIANINSRLPWQFHPQVARMRVHPGALNETLFYASNQSGRAIVGQAVPSIAPNNASLYFNKTECFCFSEQLLRPGEARDMPVRFFVDPALPPEIDTLILSYTFFNNELATARIAAADSHAASGS